MTERGITSNEDATLQETNNEAFSSFFSFQETSSIGEFQKLENDES